VFWVISVYFNIRNTLPKFGTFLLGHPIYSVRYYLGFHITAVGLGTYYPWIQKSTCILKFGVLAESRDVTPCCLVQVLTQPLIPN
jgi:hypothetical protein